MIPLLFAAALAASPILKDSPEAPAPRLFDPPGPSFILKDPPLAQPYNPLDGSPRSFILKIAADPARSPLPALPGQAQHPPPETCAARFRTLTAGRGGAALKKLGDLPPGLLEHAVLRSVGGCPVREIVSGGRTYYIAGSDPRLERADPAAYGAPQR